MSDIPSVPNYLPSFINNESMFVDGGSFKPDIRRTNYGYYRRESCIKPLNLAECRDFCIVGVNTFAIKEIEQCKHSGAHDLHITIEGAFPDSILLLGI